MLGYSAGANRARQLANELNAKGVRVDLLVYLGGDTIDNTAASRPPNVGQIVNITGHGYLPRGGDLFFNGTDLDGAEPAPRRSPHAAADAAADGGDAGDADAGPGTGAECNGCGAVSYRIRRAARLSAEKRCVRTRRITLNHRARIGSAREEE